MTSLIKNQIIKRLSKFVKNLSSNQINLSALKGEGELSSINLDETALEEVTELPKWLKISKATCGRVFIKIPWTSLKTLPIQLQLDDVVIEIETCENLRNVQTNEILPNSNNNDPLLGKYGFTNRVIDGISLTITNLTFQIRAQGFKASIFLPSLDIYSTTPDGRQVNNLTFTRVRNATRDHILLFKEISWPNARIEASAIKDTIIPGTAIRLIANTCRIRIAMKKNLQDSSMITSRVMIQFEDLLSVVNDAQLHSALNAYKEITHLMKKASEQRKRYASEKLTRAERQQQPSTFQPRAPGTNFSSTSPFANVAVEPIKDAFGRYDVIETSLHFNIKRLDLHILADGEGQPDRCVENGSIQMTIANVSIDHYPYHEYGSSKRHWNNYNEMQANNRNDWAQKLYDDWYEQLNTAKASVASDETSAKLEKALRTNRIRLFESATVLNIDDFVFYPVSLSQDKQQKRRRPLITSDKTYYQLPDSLGIINIQHSEYYYPSPYAFPVPNSDLYVQIMPLVLRVDFVTLSWLNSFLLTLSLTITKSGILKPNEIQQDLEHVAIQCEAMLPRIVLSSESFQRDETIDPSKCDVLELNVSRFVVTNVRSTHRKKLDEHLESFEKSKFFQQTQWPFSADSSNRRISSLFDKHPYETYLYKNPLSEKTSSLPDPRLFDEALHTYYTMTTNSLKKSAKFDIWHFNVENVYLDFTPSSSTPSIRLAKQNICDTLSLIGWAVLDEKRQDEKRKAPWINVISVVETATILKISQRQFTFLMNLIDELTIFLDLIERHQIETRRIKEIYSGTIRSKNDLKLTICLSVRTALTLAVIDRLQETIVQITNSNENEKETTLRDTSDSTVVIDVVTTPAAIIAGTTKLDPMPMNIASSVNFSDFSDETASQMDLSEDLDADFESSALVNDFEVPQNKATRLNVDEDSWSLSGKTTLTTTAIDSANGVFIKLNQINVCITDEEMKENVPLYIACNVHHVRIDEFLSLRFDTIKPKLFQNEKIDELNSNDVQPIDVRIDLIKGENSPPPHVALQVANRSLSIGSHAIEILVQTFDEKPSPEKNLPLKILPIDIFLHNFNLCLHLTEICPTTQLLIETKPTLNVNIEDLHILRQIDGQVKVQQQKPTENFRSNSKENLNEIQSESELLRRENERLRSELNVYQTEISVLRGERDSLMKTISKLDIELTQAEYQRVAEQQKPVKKK